MNKQTKMIVGVGAVAIVGYLVYKNMSKPKPGFANLTSSSTSKLALSSGPHCPCKCVEMDKPAPGWCLCEAGHSCPTKKAATTTTSSFAGREF